MFFILLFSFLVLSHQFNLDTQSVHVVKSKNGMFGFSVALHRSTNENLILVGSPNAQTDQPGVVEGGAVYKCNIPRLDGLSEEPVNCETQIDLFNDGGNDYYNNYGDKDKEGDGFNILAQNKSLQFLGVTLKASKSYVAVCAHRYEHRYWLESYKNDLPQQLVGRCLVVDKDFEDLEPRTLVPCDNNEDSSYDSYGFCQAGTTVSLNKDDLVMGAPGLHQSLGGAFLYDLAQPVDKSEEMNRIPAPEEDFEKNKYVGYSSVICNMDGNYDNGLEMIFGGPRGNTYKGEINIYVKKRLDLDDSIIKDFSRYQNVYDENLQYNFAGEQMGSYFGHSLACTDVNADGYDDLIVGAPWYTTSYNDNNYNSADTGRIYILHGSMDLDEFDWLTDPLKITGAQPNAAFGFSLANAGDMNEDTYMDVFVGAPYHDDGQGAVFLYLGSEDGLRTQYSQIIKPSSLNVIDGQKTFGWSISGGLDMDGNGYNDVAIGAYESGHATFIRSKSIIRVVPTLDFQFLKFNKTHQITSLQVCMEYEANVEGDPLTTESLPVNFEIKLDTGDGFSRVNFHYQNGGISSIWNEKLNVSTLGLSKECTNTVDLVYDDSTGNVQPMPVLIDASLDDVLGLRSLILDQVLIKGVETSLTIQSKCHPETGICDVDMTVEVEEKTYYEEDNVYPAVVFGYIKSIKKKITVSNIGTAKLYNYAYDIVVRITLPEDVVYDDNSGEYVTVESKGTHVECTLLNEGPINDDGKNHTFYLTFDISKILEAKDLEFTVETIVNKPTVDSDPSNNNVTSIVKVRKFADLIINGGSNRNRVPFNNQYTVVNKAIGSPEVVIKHDYSVALSDYALQAEIPNITVDLYWPQQVTAQNLYLVPLYELTARTPVDVLYVCTPQIQDLYPYAVASRSLTLGDGLSLPFEDRVGELPEVIDCQENKEVCQKMSCNFDKILSGDVYTHGFKVTLRARVHEANLYNSGGITITSIAEVAGAGEWSENLVLPIKKSATATSELFVSKVTSQNLLWIIIGAVIGGLIFLVILVLILWKCGFFKRKQPPTVRADKVYEEVEMQQYD